MDTRMYPKLTPLSMLISFREVWEHNASLNTTKAHIILLDPSHNECINTLMGSLKVATQHLQLFLDILQDLITPKLAPKPNTTKCMIQDNSFRPWCPNTRE
jgi:hypothetical protein